LTLNDSFAEPANTHVGKMFRFVLSFFLFELLHATAKGGDHNSMSDVKSDVEALQTNIIEDLGSKRVQEFNGLPQHGQLVVFCVSFSYSNTYSLLRARATN